jgi:hypothetical protein
MQERRVKAAEIAAKHISEERSHHVEGTGIETPEGVLDLLYVAPDGVHGVIVREYVYGSGAPKITQEEIESARLAAAYLYSGLEGANMVVVDAVTVCWQYAGQYAFEWTKGVWRV